MNAPTAHPLADAVRCLPALRRDAVPDAGRPFIGLARRLGVFEEGCEREAIDRLSENDRRALLFFRRHLPVEVIQWLCGDEAMAQVASPEYVAFSCLYFAAEHLHATLP
jgi:hypothetical protein